MDSYFLLLFIIAVLIFAVIDRSQSIYFIQNQDPSDCLQLTSDGYSQFFDVTKLICVPCQQSNNFQKTSADGLSCVCQGGFYLTMNFGGDISCAACPTGLVASFSGWECVACQTGSGSSIPPSTGANSCPSCDGSTNHITVERLLDGSWSSSTPQRSCQTCASYTWPDSTGLECTRCNQLLSMGINSPQCQCPAGQQIGGLCFKQNSDIVSTVQQLFKVNFGSLTFDSDYFKNNAQAAAAMCNYGNRTACQLLANLCTLILYSMGQSSNPNTCTLYLAYIAKAASGYTIADWPINFPWLYYTDRTTEILTDDGITTKFTFPDSLLNLKAATYSRDGKFLGYQSTLNGLLQLCKNSENYMDAAYTFGTAYSQSCEISVQKFWDSSQYQLEFYELWLEFQENGNSNLYAVPVLIDDYVDQNGNTYNTDPTKQTNWQFVRRFFLVDNVSGKQASSAAPSPTSSTSAGGSSTQNLQAVRYAKDITIYVTLQPKQSDGLINPPYIEINYDIATSDDFLANNNVSVTFQVIYSMDLSSHERDMAIAVGVLSALAFIYSVIQTWGWSRRAGKIAVECPTLIKFFLFTCGNVANAFFVTTLGAAIWWLIFYKAQSYVYLLISSQTTSQYIAFLVVAFVLKLIDVFHVVICQTLVNIFFIDWERPHPSQTVLHHPRRHQQRHHADEHHADAKEHTTTSVNHPTHHHAPSVSIWRTYFVANEWNEIQTTRKINPIFQYVVTVFFLYCVGFGNIATADPRSDLRVTGDDMYHAPMSNMLRFGAIGIVYLLLSLLQWLFHTFVYERFFEDGVRQFIDLCSIANVSVFILENYMSGYYIHGRSVHGRADLGLRDMHVSFIKEENDLCTKRGLVTDSDQQTFEMAVPRKLRSLYDKTIMPILQPQTAATKTKSNVAGSAVVTLGSTHEHSIQAYHKMNHLLQTFIDHALKEADYIVRPKSLMETVLNVEFQEPAVDKGFFYIDGGHSFASVLMYGHEMTWTIFEVLLFAVVDLAFQNYFLDAAVTYVVMRLIISEIRDGIGRRNLIKKTLVDKRFLI